MDISLYYAFTRSDTGARVQVNRGLQEATLVTVGGRWDIVQRPRKLSMTLWNGDDPYTMDVPVLFDGFPNKSMESSIAILNQMRISPGDFTPPPQVSIDGAVPVKGATWVITDITWGNQVYWDRNGFRTRQDAVVHLLQYISPDALSIKPSSVSQTINVVAGDTLASIAKTYYGDAKLANVIQQANNIRDPKKLPKKLIIPPLIGTK